MYLGNSRSSVSPVEKYEVDLYFFDGAEKRAFLEHDGQVPSQLKLDVRTNTFPSLFSLRVHKFLGYTFNVSFDADIIDFYFKKIENKKKFVHERTLPPDLKRYVLIYKYMHDGKYKSIAKRKFSPISSEMANQILSDSDFFDVLGVTDRECRKETCENTTNALDLKLKNVTNSRFSSVYCARTDRRVKFFKESFKLTSNPGEQPHLKNVEKYLRDIHFTDSFNGLQRHRGKIFIKFVQAIFQDSCILPTKMTIKLDEDYKLLSVSDFPDLETVDCQHKTLFMMMSIKMTKQKRRSGHRNYMFVDRVNKTVSIFEPNGSCSRNFAPVAAAVEARLPHGYTHKEVGCLCSLKGPQKKSGSLGQKRVLCILVLVRDDSPVGEP